MYKNQFGKVQFVRWIPKKSDNPKKPFQSTLLFGEPINRLVCSIEDTAHICVFDLLTYEWLEDLKPDIKTERDTPLRGNYLMKWEEDTFLAKIYGTILTYSVETLKEVHKRIETSMTSNFLRLDDDKIVAVDRDPRFCQTEGFVFSYKEGTFKKIYKLPGNTKPNTQLVLSVCYEEVFYCISDKKKNIYMIDSKEDKLCYTFPIQEKNERSVKITCYNDIEKDEEVLVALIGNFNVLVVVIHLAETKVELEYSQTINIDISYHVMPEIVFSRKLNLLLITDSMDDVYLYDIGNTENCSYKRYNGVTFSFNYPNYFDTDYLKKDYSDDGTMRTMEIVENEENSILIVNTCTKQEIYIFRVYDIDNELEIQSNFDLKERVKFVNEFCFEGKEEMFFVQGPKKKIVFRCSYVFCCLV